MDAQELRNLQEAYMEVVENQQLNELSVNKMLAYKKKAEKNRDELNKKWDKGTATYREKMRVLGREEGEERASRRIEKKTGKHPYDMNALDKLKASVKKEEVDIYDIILSHLLDEGFAETPEAAEAIMVNMSEDWRDDIVEEFLDERNRGERGMSDREVTRRRNLGGNVRSKVSASSLGDHGPQSAIQKFHKTKANQRRAIHKSGRYTRGDTGESGGQGRYQANKDHSDGYPSITKRGQGPG
jgi:hypothetical protein